MRRPALAACGLCAGVALLGAGTAGASSVDDGNAGLDALAHGQYDAAIGAFTRALKAGDLAPADQEFAYLNRGKAYLGKGDRTDAAADFRWAVSLAPGDADAKEALAEALAPESAPARAGRLPPADLRRAAWGPLAGMATQTWLSIDGNPQMYVTYAWATPGQVLAFSGLSRRGEPIQGTIARDPASGKLTETSTFRGQTTTAEVEVSAAGYAETVQTATGYLRQTFTRTSADGFDVQIAVYDGSDWKPVKAVKYVRASPEMVQALNWKASGATARQFFGSLGSSLLQGALAGVASGIAGNANGQ